MSKNGLTLQLEREVLGLHCFKDQILDWFNGAGEGRKAFNDLISAVYEEEPKQALAALDQAISAVALWRVE